MAPESYEEIAAGIPYPREKRATNYWGGFVGRTKKEHIVLVVRRNGWRRVVLVWITLAFRAQRQAPKPITDLGVTMPLNQPGGAPASAEAYEVYSALYQAPVEEMLAFAEDSVTDVPQVNGNCLRPTESQEQEMTVAFVAANRQSHRWERKFSIPQGYRLLPQTELARARKKKKGPSSGMFAFWTCNLALAHGHIWAFGICDQELRPPLRKLCILR